MYDRLKFRRRCPGQLARGVLIHHGNARPHTARATQERTQELQLELLEQPPYSLDLAPSDVHLFGPLKTHLGGKRFADDEEVETEVRKWLRQQSQDFYAAGFHAVAKRWDKCINQNYWVSGLCPSSGILGTTKHNVSETGSVSVFK
jgi:hypothetical protein